MLVKVNAKEFQFLRTLEVETYGDTFGAYISDDDLEDYYQTVLSPEQVQKDLENPESETYFVLDHDQEVCGFLKFNWGKAQTESVEMNNAFEIQRIYISQAFQGMGLGKQLFEFALQEARDLGCDWVWLGVWERNFKAQIFYDKYGFEKFAEHDFPVGEGKVDCDWLLKLKL